MVALQRWQEFRPPEPCNEVIRRYSSLWCEFFPEAVESKVQTGLFIFFRVPQSVFACLCAFAAERFKIAAVFYAHENQSVPAALCHTLCWCTEHQTIDSVRPKSQSLMFKLRSRTTFKLWNRDKRRGQMETHGRMQYTPTCQKTSENYQKFGRKGKRMP